MTEKKEYQLPQQTNYETSFAMAREKLATMDFSRQCSLSGAGEVAGGAEIDFIDRKFFIDGKTFEVSAADDGEGPELWAKIITLHYFIAADGTPPSGELITYKQVPDGAPYYDIFNKRTGGILLSVFGDKMDALVETAKGIGAGPVEGHGDKAFKVRALPMVEYIFVLYEADEEFPPDIKVVFDSSIQSYLPAEDITVLCQMICIGLVKRFYS